jgi:hypothetical protein
VCVCVWRKCQHYKPWRQREWAFWETAQGLSSLTPAPVGVGIAFWPHGVTVVYPSPALQSETYKNEGGIEEVLKF